MLGFGWVGVLTIFQDSCRQSLHELAGSKSVGRLPNISCAERGSAQLSPSLYLHSVQNWYLSRYAPLNFDDDPTNQTIKETRLSTVKFLPIISPPGKQSIIVDKPGYRKYSAPWVGCNACCTA